MERDSAERIADALMDALRVETDRTLFAKPELHLPFNGLLSSDEQRMLEQLSHDNDFIPMDFEEFNR